MVKPWADGPFKLLETPAHRNARTGKTITKNEEGAHKLANVMALVHNILIRGLNAIYLQAPNISLEQDIKDFCTFMYAWSLTLHVHHDNEESLGFPLLEEMTGVKGLLDINVQQHRLFDEGLKSFDLYVARVKDGSEKYDGAHVRQLIDKLAPPLFEHLAAEVLTMEALKEHDAKIDWVNYNKKIEEHSVKGSEMYHETPFVMTNLDATFEQPLHHAIWPPFPWFAGLLLRLVYVPRNAGAWRFSSCDTKGRPKDLPFV
ncbi:hypothetical protein BP6252_10256 [Coleophoma cylindrospora]|uniref:Hemerythrin-like domain-containing protein n=1 Tax=Coleophoma cylindrospora TaxID=1849047 RepID=A0A3D8QS26_9HELO|nr:hypothetical protein BP6252_10256 [Coleophoma cylindrospora]